MTQTKASFIGIGAQKCASTWLYGVLQQCPQVRLSPVKEVDFFSYYFDRGYEWYDRHFDGTKAVRHRGEISPSYFIHPDAPARTVRYNPDIQVIVALRDPVGRAFSNHLHEVRKGHVSGANTVFETALDNNPLYRDQGRYATHLARWLDHVPRERLHVFFQEEIHADRAGEARRLTDALGLAPLEEFLDLRANESVRYRNPALGQALWRVGDYARRNGLGEVIERVKSAPGIRQMRASNREELRDAVAPMRAETEAALTAFYASEVAELERLLGRSVPWPRFTAARST